MFLLFKYHGSTIQNVREAVKIVSDQLGIPSYPVAVALDTKGPEIRTGLLVDVRIFVLYWLYKISMLDFILLFSFCTNELHINCDSQYSGNPLE